MKNYSDRTASRVNFSQRRLRDTKWANEYNNTPYLKYPYLWKFSMAEKHYLFDVPRRLGEGNYADLGVFKGASTAALAFGLKEISANTGKVFAVDTFIKNVSYYKPLMIESFKDLDIIQYLKICKGTTEEWAKKLRHLKFRFVHIDADHSYNFVKKDFELWSPLVDLDGEIAFHDVHLDSVNRVIEEEVLQDWEQIGHYFMLKVFRRKNCG